MNKKKLAVTIFIVLFLSVFVVGAITEFFASKSVTVTVTKKKYFRFDFELALDNAELGPGDSVAVNPIVKSDSTEEMYVFMKVTNPSVNNVPLYTYDVDDSWIVVDDSMTNAIVYAYASSDSMAPLSPGEETNCLTNKMTMRDISIPEYASIDNIDFTFEVFAVGTEGIDMNPTDAWAEAKQLFLQI